MDVSHCIDFFLKNMDTNALINLSPLDGRYAKQTAPLRDYFSEHALVKHRVLVEMEYFLFLAEEGFFELTPADFDNVRKVAADYHLDNTIAIKRLESVTNHDVKAVEYFIKEQLASIGLGNEKEWVHFGLTSQDINNTAIPLMWKDYLENHYRPSLERLVERLRAMARTWKKVPMLARTHGQPASPTTVGKEMMVFVERLENQKALLATIPFTGKFGGATGNFNAHVAAFPERNWPGLADRFVEGRLGLKRCKFTTQIEHYDNLAAQCDAIKRTNNILTDFCRDVWEYISLDYFRQRLNPDEVGSSAMPHKVNPIDFENAEGNLGIANALLEHFAAKLPISRLQRDLTDSTVLRNLGVPMGHVAIAMESLAKGIAKLTLNETKLASDLDNNWTVVAEAIQTILRKEHYPDPYEALKALSRGNHQLGKVEIHQFINGLSVPEAVKTKLLSIRPDNYIGTAGNF